MDIRIQILFSCLLLILSCNQEKQAADPPDDPAVIELIQKEFTTTMQKHLDAVSNKDLNSLKSTMSPDGRMQLILPGEEIRSSVDSFMEFHRNWFQDTTWTFETKVLNQEIGQDFGMAIVEVIYREPERDGEPYFNRMIVSYDLQRINKEWYIIKDHATSVEKSTDQ